MKRAIAAIAIATPLLAIAENKETFSDIDICKAAVSVEMKRDVKTMKSVANKDGYPQIEYTRDDGDKFKYQCKIDGKRIAWRTHLGAEGWGRWRDGIYDAVITHEIKGDTLHVESSHSDRKPTFKLGDFK